MAEEWTPFWPGARQEGIISKSSMRLHKGFQWMDPEPTDGPRTMEHRKGRERWEPPRMLGREVAREYLTTPDSRVMRVCVTHDLELDDTLMCPGPHNGKPQKEWNIRNSEGKALGHGQVRMKLGRGRPEKLFQLSLPTEPEPPSVRSLSSEPEVASLP